MGDARFIASLVTRGLSPCSTTIPHACGLLFFTWQSISLIFGLSSVFHLHAGQLCHEHHQLQNWGRDGECRIPSCDSCYLGFPEAVGHEGRDCTVHRDERASKLSSLPTVSCPWKREVLWWHQKRETRKNLLFKKWRKIIHIPYNSSF